MVRWSGGQMGTGSQAACFALKFIQAVLNRVYFAGICTATGPYPYLTI